MEQKQVTFKVAKAIKEAGYPQGKENTAWYNENGWLVKPFVFNGGNEIADAPTYLDVWLWLWREKGIEILPTGGIVFQGKGKLETKNLYNYPNDPEEIIITSIDYLVDNDLIKNW